ncbi:O-antigen ligase family protein [Polaribacter uvawellassae]|uniref:O-antigen ligase family protein n=1 Tax=Polaribacter uvawellassae TaxID=3133495 RepID=UPI003219BAFB
MELEIVFSILMVSLPFIALINKNFLPFFFVLLVGANPYVSASALLLSLIFRLKNVIKVDIDKRLFALFFIWFFYSLLLGFINYNDAFIPELIQLFIGIMLVLYVDNFINNKKKFYKNITYLLYSGVVLCFFEIVIYFYDLKIITSAFIDFNSNNYTSFYLLISTVIVPLFLMKNNKFFFVFSILGVFVIYLNDSRANLILALILIIREFISFKSYLVKFLIVCILGYIFYFFYNTFDSSMVYDSKSIYSVANFENNFSNLERIDLITYSINLFNENILGYGLGSSFEIFVNNNFTANSHYPHPHNTLAFLSVEIGFVGVFVYFLFFYNMVKNYIKIEDDGIRRLIVNITISLFAFSIVDVIFYNGILMLFSFILFGFSLVASKISFR